ncbi:MAG: hypothetical protein ACREQK_15645, partial [Candidatus Binatia bacterium]
SPLRPSAGSNGAHRRAMIGWANQSISNPASLIAYAKIGSRRKRQRLAKGGQELLIDIIENMGHNCWYVFKTSAILR